MVASTDIKFYVHTNNNAPQLQNAYGSMINVLDACLVDGINIGAVSSLTTSGKTVTATFGSGHNLMQYQVIKITGATQSEFNGEHRILTIPNAQSVTFELAASPSTNTATGTISASLPPLGWEKPFSSVNAGGGGKAAYRSKNLLLPSRPFLRVVDELDPVYTATYAKYAKAGIVEDMTDIDTMLGVQAPFDAALPDKNWTGTGSGSSAYNGWAKWYYASSVLAGQSSDSTAPTNGNRDWILVGSKDYFYILPAAIPNGKHYSNYGFGAFESLLDLDNANCFLSASVSYSTAGTTLYRADNTGLGSTNSTGRTILLRDHKQELPTHARTYSFHAVTSGEIYSGYMDYIAPKSVANTIPIFPIFLRENNGVIRGQIPNFYWVLQAKPHVNLAVLEKDNSAFMAINSVVGTAENQIVVKIGDLI
ncbi:MAG: hypothetical protein ACN6NW_15625 [Acinetobacter amyesii]|uniref:hypothetical protein n=1 Tax=Acinetobacter amyesii TaxID=2942470 RepID=UPI003CFC0E50